MQTKLFNPLSHDFNVTYDINNDEKPLSYTIHAGEIEAFEKPVAEHIKNKLGYTRAMELKGNGTYEDAWKRALEEIEVRE